MFSGFLTMATSRTSLPVPITSPHQIRYAAVLGAGIMGRQIAARLASVGVSVVLLDLPQPGNKNKLAEEALAKLPTQKPRPFYRESDLRRITPGNYDDHLTLLEKAHLIIEVIRENIEEKLALFSRIAPFVRSNALIASNTSSIPVRMLAAGMPEQLRTQFVGGFHFFNPEPLELLELIFAPTATRTQQDVISRFASDVLAKEIVIAHDTPAFVANRIGVFALMRAMQEFASGAYTIEEIELLTGPLVGRPASATFRTADKVGLGTVLNVTSGLHQHLVTDPYRAVFAPPEPLKKLVERGDLGAEKGRGFSTKDRATNTICNLDLQTLEYRAPSGTANLGDLSTIIKLPTPAARLRALLDLEGRAGDFIRSYFLELLHYCAICIPEITDLPADLDTALRAGFLWDIGPFQLWNAIGSVDVAQRMSARGLALPEWIREAIFTHGMIPTLPDLFPSKAPAIHTAPESALIDIGDGVLHFELRSKANTLSFSVIEELEQALDTVSGDKWLGMVIGNPASGSFCGGANVREIGGAVKSGQLSAVDDLVSRFQRLMNRIYTFRKPLAGAIKGLALGGGAELSIALPLIAAHPNTYVGLVELGVGLIPAGVGSTHFAFLAAEQAASKDLAGVLPFFRQNFERIAMGMVTNNGYEAIDAGFFGRGARIVPRADQIVAAAKSLVVAHATGPYLPRPPRGDIFVLGAEGRAPFEQRLEEMKRSGFIAPYDAVLAQTLLFVMTGGVISSPQYVSEQYLLELEREQFVWLLTQEGTHKKLGRFLKGLES
jgi:3-hydroxyacyl-CoA dehydrogenase